MNFMLSCNIFWVHTQSTQGVICKSSDTGDQTGCLILSADQSWYNRWSGRRPTSHGRRISLSIYIFHKQILSEITLWRSPSNAAPPWQLVRPSSSSTSHMGCVWRRYTTMSNRQQCRRRYNTFDCGSAVAVMCHVQAWFSRSPELWISRLCTLSSPIYRGRNRDGEGPPQWHKWR